VNFGHANSLHISGREGLKEMLRSPHLCGQWALGKECVSLALL